MSFLNVLNGELISVVLVVFFFLLLISGDLLPLPDITPGC